MDMFVFWRNNSRIVSFEEIGYVLVDREPHTHRYIDCTSLKLQCKEPAKQGEINKKYSPYALKKYSTDVDNDSSNLSLLK